MQSPDIGVERIVLTLDQIPLRAPPPHLTLEITGGLAEVAESDRLRIDGVQVGEHLDQRVDTAADRRLVAQRLEFVGVPNDPTGHVLHHLERRAADRVVVAHGDCTRDGDRGVRQGGDHPILAGHIVRRRRQPVQRRPAQHPLRLVVADQKRQVGPTAGDQLGPQLAAARNAHLLEVAVKGVEVEPLQRSRHRTCLPPLISRQQVPYVFGAVDRGDVEVAAYGRTAAV